MLLRLLRARFWGEVINIKKGLSVRKMLHKCFVPVLNSKFPVRWALLQPSEVSVAVVEFKFVLGAGSSCIEKALSS